MRQSRGVVWYPVWIGTLAAAVWLGASTGLAQSTTTPADSCLQRWTYVLPSAAYLSSPLVSNSTGDFFWSETSFASGDAPIVELVAVGDGRTRWRRRLSTSRRPAPSRVAVALLTDDLLAVAFQSKVEGRRTSDGRVVWSRDLRADLAPELRRAGLARNTELQPGEAARVGRALVTEAAVSRTAAWLTATALDGKLLWRARAARPVARMVSDGARLYMLYAESAGGPEIVALDSNGTAVAPAPGPPGSASNVPFTAAMAVRGDELVFDTARVVTARVGPEPIHCPPMSPSCRPPPFVLTVAGFAQGQERWHLSHAVGEMRVWGLLLLGDGSVILVDDRRVGRLSSDGNPTPLCELPLDAHGSIAGLVNGDLVVAFHEQVSAYTLPGAPQLAATGWVMRGGGPAKGWAVREGSARAGQATQYRLRFP